MIILFGYLATVEVYNEETSQRGIRCSYGHIGLKKCVNKSEEILE